MSIHSSEKPSEDCSSVRSSAQVGSPERDQTSQLLTYDDEGSLKRDIDALGTIVLQHFEQRERPQDFYSRRRTNKPKIKQPFPSRRVIRRITAMPIQIEGENGATADAPGTKRPKVLSRQQFHALYNAIASSSGWWPLADLRWDSWSYFSNLEKYVMYLDDMPIGFGALDRNSDGTGVTRIVFVGVTNSMQGYRFGFYLFNFLNHLAREGDTHSVVLNTAPEFDVMRGAGKPKQSAVKMYLAAGFRLIRTDTIDAKQVAASGQHLQTLNLPAYYRNHPQFAKEALLKRLCEEFHCRMPRLPARAKGS